MIVKNFRNEEFNVTLGKFFEFGDCNPFMLVEEQTIPQDLKEFFSMPIRINLANVGCVIWVENKAKDLVESGYQLPIYVPCDEYECDAIYSHIRNGECI